MLSNVTALYLDLLKIISVDLRILGLAIAVLCLGYLGNVAWLYLVWNFGFCSPLTSYLSKYSTLVDWHSLVLGECCYFLATLLQSVSNRARNKRKE